MASADHDPNLTTLRQQAERALTQDDVDTAHLSRQTMQEIINELRVHQVELELQNEELQRARRDTEAQRARFAELYDSAPVGYLTVDRQGVIREANRSARFLLAGSIQELIGRRLDDWVSSGDRDAFFLFMRRLFQTGRQRDVLVLLGPEGEAWVAQIDARVVTTGSDAGQTCRLVLSDITMNQQAEAWRAQRDWLDETLSSIGDALITTDIHGVVTFLNRAAIEFTGWSSERAVGRPLDVLWSLVDEQTRQPAGRLVSRMLQSETEVAPVLHAVWVSHDEPARIVAACVSPISARGGPHIHGAVVVFRDITVQRRMEADLMRTQKLESVGVLAGGIAHDFNNLLTGIMGNVSVARRLAPSPGQMSDRLLEAENACQRATALTYQLLTFARGGAPLRQTVAIGNLVTEAATFSVRGSTARLEVELTEDLWPVDADAGQLSQVIHNMVLNAVQAMPDGGHIRVVVANRQLRAHDVPTLTAGRYVTITFNDTGCGISDEILLNIFDPYYTTKSYGNGLGLAMADAIIRKHDGFITVESEVGVGATFVIYLPASFGAPRVAPLEAMSAVQGQGRVLVMDDEEMILEVLQAMLTSMGYTVDCACDGAEAVARYRQAHASSDVYKFVILDITVPGGMGGLDALAEMQRIEPQVVALISSGYANDPVLAKFAEYGFRGVLPKPYTEQKLRAVLQGVWASQGCE